MRNPNNMVAFDAIVICASAQPRRLWENAFQQDKTTPNKIICQKKNIYTIHTCNIEFIKNITKYVAIDPKLTNRIFELIFSKHTAYQTRFLYWYIYFGDINRKFQTRSRRQRCFDNDIKHKWFSKFEIHKRTN